MSNSKIVSVAAGAVIAFLGFYYFAENSKPKLKKEKKKNMPLSESTIKVIQATAGVVAEHALDITKTFYHTMFTNNPEVLAFFNKAHQAGGFQPRALADAVIAYASNIDKLHTLGPLVEKIAHRHVALSVKPEMYGIVHKNLMIAIGNVLGDAVTPEIAQAWDEAVLALAKICIDAEEALYKQMESRKGGWRYEREFIVSKIEPKGDDVKLFEFEASDGYKEGFEFTAGQYLTIRIADDVAPRHYTLTCPSGSTHLQIVTRHLKGGQVSTFMHTELKVGDKVKLGVPCGVFVAPEGANETKNVLLSAGIGATPMIAFTKTLKNVIGFHVEHSESRCAFKEEFAAQPDYTVVYTEKAGKPNLKEKTQELVKKAGTEANYYICGPTKFMADMEQALKTAGALNIHSEVFGTGNVQSNLQCPMAK